MMMKGKISQWKDEMGFGFIQPDDGSQKLFFHISNIKNNTRSPEIDDSVFYESMYDSQHRLTAKKVLIKGASSLRHQHSLRIQQFVNNVIDYISILVVSVSFIVSGVAFYHTNTIQISWPNIALVVIALLILSRKIKSRYKSFRCSVCNGLTKYDAQTIQVWNNEVVDFYCAPCHLEWLSDRPQQELIQIKSPRVSYSKLVIFMIIIPVLSSVILSQKIM